MRYFVSSMNLWNLKRKNWNIEQLQTVKRCKIFNGLPLLKTVYGPERPPSYLSFVLWLCFRGGHRLSYSGYVSMSAPSSYQRSPADDHGTGVWLCVFSGAQTPVSVGGGGRERYSITKTTQTPIRRQLQIFALYENKANKDFPFDVYAQSFMIIVLQHVVIKYTLISYYKSLCPLILFLWKGFLFSDSHNKSLNYIWRFIRG